MHVLQALAKLGTVMGGHGVYTGVIREGIWSARFTPDVIRLAKTTFRPLGIVVSHRLDLGDLLKELVEVIIRQVV